MDNLNQNHSGTGDNIGRDKITNIQVKNDKLIRKAQEAYSKIYHWHKKYGRKIYGEYYEDEVGEELSGKYYDLVDTLPAPYVAELDEMISICKKFYNGVLSWSSGETVVPLSKKERLIKYANEVINSKKKFTAKMFNEIQLDNQDEYYSKSKEILYQTNKELKQIEKENLNSKRIGGLNTVIESSKEFGSPIILTPELLGYKLVDEEKSLLNKVKKGEVSIDGILLKSYNRGESQKIPYYVDLSLTNQMNYEIDVFIPEGQIFENREYLIDGKPTQNLATAEVANIKLKANESINIKIPSFCMNKNYSPPNNEEGNLAIYEFAKKGFKDNGQFWDWIERNYNRIKERFK